MRNIRTRQVQDFLSPFQGLEIYLPFNPGRRSPTRFALGYYLPGFQPYGIAKPAKIGFTQFAAEKSRALKVGDEVLLSGVGFAGRGSGS
jgi:hypothetical protein